MARLICGAPSLKMSEQSLGCPITTDMSNNGNQLLMVPAHSSQGPQFGARCVCVCDGAWVCEGVYRSILTTLPYIKTATRNGSEQQLYTNSS